MKKDTYLPGRKPYHPQAPDIEAAKHLRNMAALYVKRRATVGDVEVAITEFRAALATAKG